MNDNDDDAVLTEAGEYESDDDRELRALLLHDAHKRELAARTQALDERELELAAREQELGVRRQAFAATLAQREQEARAALQAEIEAQRLDLVRRIAAERAQRLDLLDEETRAMRERAAQDLARTREAEAAELRTARERQLAALDEERARHDAALHAERERAQGDARRTARELAEREQTLAEAVRAQRLQQMRLDQQESETLQKGIDAERNAEQRVRWIEEAAEARQAGLESDLRRAFEQVANLEARLRRLDELELRFGESAEGVLQRLEAAERRAAQLQEELRGRPTLEDRLELHALREEKQGWAAQLERQGFELAKLVEQQYRWVRTVAEIESQRSLAETANRHLEALELRMRVYAEEVERLQGIHAKGAQPEARRAALTQPQILDVVRAGPQDAPSEQAWLDGIRLGCAELGMHFPRRLLYAFHTALKSADSAPLTVLAGVSGTGKSALPRLYAHLGGVAFMELPVQPNWDSPQSLFGYYNPLDTRFHATPLLRALVQAQQDHAKHEHGLADRLMIVLLDEMNLAHVELYFSDLLSGLEGRPYKTVTQSIDLGADVEPYQLTLGDNVLWVGTMNEDETTKALSDKVVDRANTLYFPRPQTLRSRRHTTLPPAAPLLAAATWQGWRGRGADLPEVTMDAFRKALEAINRHLEHAGRALGHRVWQAVETYIANHPDVLAAQKAPGQPELVRALQVAFEDQLVFKVMPKLRGIETGGTARTQCLDPIGQLLAQPELGLSLGEDFAAACGSPYGVFAWNSAHYLGLENG
jgi:hypothetical protein